MVGEVSPPQHKSKGTLHMKLSLQDRMFIGIGIFTVLALLAIWIILRPTYETSIIAEHMNTIRHLQTYAIEDLDHTIANWSDVTHFIAWQVTERPNEGETVLRSMGALHPEIIQIRIQSPKLSDELTSQNTQYPPPEMQIKDSMWIRLKIDSVLHAAWLNDTSAHRQFFVTQTRFYVQNIPFVLTVVWDAKKMNTVFDELPLGEGYSASIQSASSALLRNASSFNAREMLSMQKSGNTALSVHQNDTTWCVLTNEFKTVQLWMVIAVPEKTILKPVKDLMLYLTLFIIGLAFMMLLLGYMLSLQIKRPIASLTNDVQRLSNLEFTQTIQITAMKDLLGLGEAIERMRQSLEQHQHLHHESNHADSGEYQDGNSNGTLS